MDSLFLTKVIYFYILAFLLAVLEIQIEGKHGWAAKLPTWRVEQGSKLDKIFKKVASQKELTGYHLALNTFLLLFLHWPFIWSGSWSIWQELEILSIFIIFTAVWDFLWFVLNPNLSLRKFNKERVWWHKKWLAGMPVDYYMAILASIVLFLPELIFINPISAIYKMTILLGVNFILIAFTVIVYPKAY